MYNTGAMLFAPDAIELTTHSRAEIERTWRDLNPAGLPVYTRWRAWLQSHFADDPACAVVLQTCETAIARMARRNGALSPNPRRYHNEHHIEELLDRLMCCHSENAALKTPLPPRAWLLLSIFAACHDLHQGHKNTAQPSDRVGANEAASFCEAERLLQHLDPAGLIGAQQIALLRLMIHGSTFGSGQQKRSHALQGNLVVRLLQQSPLADETDRQTVLLACDIDTANVSLDLVSYARTAARICRELNDHHASKPDPMRFFTEQQKRYFFDLQQYHSDLAQRVLLPAKVRNQPLVEALCLRMQAMSLPPHDVAAWAEAFVATAEALVQSTDADAP